MEARQHGAIVTLDLPIRSLCAADPLLLEQWS
jgi:hypothetical protein